MKCAEFRNSVSDYVDGTRHKSSASADRSTCRRCAACRELLRDVFQAVSFMGRVEEVAPPPELITRLAYHAPRGKVRDGPISGVCSADVYQMVAAGASAALRNGHGDDHLCPSRCWGAVRACKLQQISPADLSPARVWGDVEDKAYRSWNRTVKYYENLRLVYEIETRLQEIRDQQDKMPAPNAATQSGESSAARQNKGTTQQ